MEGIAKLYQELLQGGHTPAEIPGIIAKLAATAQTLKSRMIANGWPPSYVEGLSASELFNVSNQNSVPLATGGNELNREAEGRRDAESALSGRASAAAQLAAILRQGEAAQAAENDSPFKLAEHLRNLGRLPAGTGNPLQELLGQGVYIDPQELAVDPRIGELERSIQDYAVPKTFQSEQREDPNIAAVRAAYGRDPAAAARFFAQDPENLRRMFGAAAGASYTLKEPIVGIGARSGRTLFTAAENGDERMDVSKRGIQFKPLPGVSRSLTARKQQEIVRMARRPRYGTPGPSSLNRPNPIDAYSSEPSAGLPTTGPESLVRPNPIDEYSSVSTRKPVGKPRPARKPFDIRDFGYQMPAGFASGGDLASQLRAAYAAFHPAGQSASEASAIDRAYGVREAVPQDPNGPGGDPRYGVSQGTYNQNAGSVPGGNGSYIIDRNGNISAVANPDSTFQNIVSRVVNGRTEYHTMTSQERAQLAGQMRDQDVNYRLSHMATANPERYRRLQENTFDYGTSWANHPLQRALPEWLVHGSTGDFLSYNSKQPVSPNGVESTGRYIARWSHGKPVYAYPDPDRPGEFQTDASLRASGQQPYDRSRLAPIWEGVTVGNKRGSQLTNQPWGAAKGARMKIKPYAGGGGVKLREASAIAVGKALQSNPFAHPDMVSALLAGKAPLPGSITKRFRENVDPTILDTLMNSVFPAFGVKADSVMREAKTFDPRGVSGVVTVRR